ncbi:LysR family transcriptional regulator [Acuticoccus sp. MNP-M23]|uniref:LysR family transcriptional regulator n=1 Tax=Acuticoccus sp. MNP-M23 TaxID=3072793 RepID=UPI002815BC98|nr:LysR family transcriptional regulator [Acuticoccus sp. MNP-M23]WMS43654.1 LysR family transcriptional regulator [Acuticoccus sp. MNP-M23]
MDWDKLRVFHAAAQKGSFTHAGEELGISQSAVSRQVHALEMQIGVTLFHRHARGLLLTEQGEQLFQTTSGIARELQAVSGALVDSRDRPRGVLRVTTTIGLGSSWLSARVKDFVELYPDVQLELIFDDNELDIGMREADIAIRWRQPVQPDLVQRRLFTVHFHVYASAGYVEQFGAPRTVKDLDDHRLVTFGPNPPAYLRELNWLETAGREDDEPRQPRVRVNNMLAMRTAISSGAGVGVLPDFVVDEDKSLIRLDLVAEPPSYNLYFVYASELRNSARVQAFRDFVLAKAEAWRY